MNVLFQLGAKVVTQYGAGVIATGVGTFFAVGTGRFKATFDAKVARYDCSRPEEALPTVKLIGGVAIPLLLGVLSLKLSQWGSRALAPKLSMRKVVQIDPKLAWATAGVKLVARLPYLINGLAFVLPYVNTFRSIAGKPGHPYAVSQEESSFEGSVIPRRRQVQVSWPQRAQIFVNWDAVCCFYQDLKNVPSDTSRGQHLLKRLREGYSEAGSRVQGVAHSYLLESARYVNNLLNW